MNGCAIIPKEREHRIGPQETTIWMNQNLTFGSENLNLIITKTDPDQQVAFKKSLEQAGFNADSLWVLMH